MFRKIYWVTEQVDSFGNSRVSGVYTSIPELIKRGLCWETGSLLRLTLTKLDSDKEPFGTWCEPDFSGLEERIDEFIKTDEITRDHCQMLIESLERRATIAA